MLQTIRKRYFGDKAFYKAVLAIIIPVIIQNSISNFVSLLDNLMVGAVGESQMNGVSISNQIVFVFNLAIFGGMSGATIFGAQFFGAKDEKGVTHSMRFAMYVAAVVGIVATVFIGIFRQPLIERYITPGEGADAAVNAADTLSAGLDYITVILWGLIPFAVTNAYAGMLRVTGETKLPMVASIISVLTNLVFNWLLIFDHGTFITGMGAKGAAIATVISRYVEMGIIVIVSHRRARKGEELTFLNDVYKSFRIPGGLLKSICIKGLPLLANELLWSTGMAELTHQYSYMGLTVVAAINVTNTINNLFNVVFISMGTAASILVGQSLGANDWEGAKDNARKLIMMEEIICLCTCAVLVIFSRVLPNVYTQTTPETRALATKLIRICACELPISGFAHCAYFILRAGGKTFITMLFDSVYTWVFPVPLVWALVHFTSLTTPYVYFGGCFINIVKVILGYILLKKGIWIHNIVENEAEIADN